MNKLGCDYQGKEFGASYLDSQCFDGYLWDADSCDEPGGVLNSGGSMPCPKCNHEEWLKSCCEDIYNSAAIDGYDNKPRKNPIKETQLKYPDDFEAMEIAWYKGYDDGLIQKAIT